MIKLTIAAVILAVAGVAWLRMQWAIDKNKRAASKIIDGLKNGTYTVESFEESLGMMIRTKALSEAINVNSFQQKLAELTSVKFTTQIKVLHSEMNNNNKGIVIAEGTVKDVLTGNKEVDVVYPCWLYIEVAPAGNEIYFKSSMPDGKDHHHLLEDISDVIHERLIKQ